MKRFAVILVSLILFSGLNFAQSNKFDSIVVKGIRHIYSIEFDQAEKTFQQLIKKYPDHPAGKFFIAMVEWWKILLDTSNEHHDELFRDKLEQVIEQCDNILDKDPENVEALFFKGGSIGFRGRLSSLRESWLSAADDGREALPLVELAGELDPANIDVQLGFGIYNYYAAVIPEKYPIVKPLMFFLPAGDKKLGMDQLKNVALNGKYTNFESRYFLMSLFYRFEKDYDKAEEYALMLTDDFPNNPVFEGWRGRIAVKAGELNLADSVFKNILSKAERDFTGYNSSYVIREANYYIAYNYRSIAMYDSAEVYFNKCIEHSIKIDKDEESGFLINATLYLGMIKEFNREYSAAKMYYEKVLDMREYNNSHTLAETYLERIENKN